MVDLDDISNERLRAALNEVAAKRPTQRLTAAIAYKSGVTQSEIASWYGVERKTVYNWLCRFESSPGSLADAARDEDRPGRPSRLGDDHRERLAKLLDTTPKEAGYDATAWSPELLQRFLEERWNLHYSLRSCRRILSEL